MESSSNFNQWMSIAQFIWLIGLTLGAFLRKPGEDAARDLAQLRGSVTVQNEHNATSIAELRGAQQLLEERMRHLPTHGDIRALIDGLADLRGKVASVADGQQRQQHTLNLIQEFMTKQ